MKNIPTGIQWLGWRQSGPEDTSNAPNVHGEHVAKRRRASRIMATSKSGRSSTKSIFLLPSEGTGTSIFSECALEFT